MLPAAAGRSCSASYERNTWCRLEAALGACRKELAVLQRGAAAAERRACDADERATAAAADAERARQQCAAKVTHAD